MRIFVKGGAVIGLALLASASPAKAQGVEFSLGGGISNPLGTFNDATKLGWNGLAGLSFVPTGWPVGIQVDGEYQQFPFDGFSGHERFLIGTGKTPRASRLTVSYNVRNPAYTEAEGRWELFQRRRA